MLGWNFLLNTKCKKYIKKFCCKCPLAVRRGLCPKASIKTNPPFEPCGDIRIQELHFSQQGEEEQLQANPFVKTVDNYKRIDTTLSSIDISRTNMETKYSTRKTKSQEDVHKTSSQVPEDLLEWFHGIYNAQKEKKWSTKFQKLGEKLKKPGGEEKLKNQIRKFLHQVPSQFSDEDEEGKEFREKLPDYIIKKLKKLLLKTDKMKHVKGVPSQTVIIDSSKADKHTITNSGSNLKVIVSDWVANVPIKKKSFPLKHVTKQDVIDSIVQRLEPFMLYRPECRSDYKCMLKSYIVEILCEVPLQNNLNNNRFYINSTAGELVERILRLDQDYNENTMQPLYGEASNNIYDQVDTELYYGEALYNRSSQPSSEKSDIKQIKDFVTDELTRYLRENSFLINKNRMTCVEMEIVGMFLEELNFPGMNTDKERKFDICEVLQEVGRLPHDEAKIFSETIIYNFKRTFHDKLHKSKNGWSDVSSEVFLVNYPKLQTMKGLNRFSMKCIDDSVRNFYTEMSIHIEHWLNNFKQRLPLLQIDSFREMAIKELTELVVNRFKFLELNPSKRGSVAEEAEQLKFLIYKWVRKIVGDDKIDILQEIPSLLKRIQTVSVPTFGTLINRCSSSSRTPLQNGKVVKELYDAIFDWYFDLPQQFHDYHERKTKKQNIKKLAESIEKYLNSEDRSYGVVNREIDSWVEKVFINQPTRSLIEDLKTKIQITCLEAKYTADVSFQVKIDTSDVGIKTSLQIENPNPEECSESLRPRVIKQIDEWLRNLPEKPIYNETCKQTAIENLAADIIDRQRYINLNPLFRGTDEEEIENLKYQIFKWFNALENDDNFITVHHASELMQRLQYILPYIKVGKSSLDDENCQEIVNRVDGKTAKTRKWNANIVISPNKGFRGLHGRIYDSFNKSTSNKEIDCDISKSISEDFLARCKGLPVEMTLAQTYEYFDHIFQKRCQELPMDESTPDQKNVAEKTRGAVYNEIWKTYFRLKSDPSIENDYILFEAILDDHLDKILNCLPQTKEIVDFREVWKLEVVLDATRMLEYVRDISSAVSFRQMLIDKFDRHFVRLYSKSQSNIMQHNLTVSIVEAYILYSRYKTSDPLKANDYRQQFMKSLEELTKYLKNSLHVDLNPNQLCQEAYKILGSIDLPDDDILKSEVEELLLSNEIEQWYKELPVKPIKTKLDSLIRKRMTDTLAKKILGLEMKYGTDNTKLDKEVIVEIKQFLKGDTQLGEEQNLNIVAEELLNRLKKRRNDTAIRRDSFVFTQHNEVIAVPSLCSQSKLTKCLCDIQFNKPDGSCDVVSNLKNGSMAKTAYNANLSSQLNGTLSSQIVNSYTFNSGWVWAPNQEGKPQVLTNSNELAKVPQGNKNEQVITNQISAHQNQNGKEMFNNQTCKMSFEQILAKNYPTPSSSQEPNLKTVNDKTEVMQAQQQNGFGLYNADIGKNELISEDEEIRVRCQCTERIYKCCKKRKLYDDTFVNPTHAADG